MNEQCKNIRRNIVKLIYKQGGHLGGSLSAVEIYYTLYGSFFNKKEPNIIISIGHSAPALISTLYELHMLSKPQLDSYGKNGSKLTGHVSSAIPGVMFSSGALGNGLGVSIGLILGDQIRSKKNKFQLVVLSDGELNEGSTYEAFALAGSLKLPLIAVLDFNGIQASDFTDNIINTKPILKAIRELGWGIISCNGHSVKDIKKSVIKAGSKKSPILIVAKTIKGKGVSFMENSPLWHHSQLNDMQYDVALEDLS